MKKFAFIGLLLAILLQFSKAQIENPVKWTFDYRYITEKTIEVKFTAIIEKKWHMYGAYFPNGGPIPTTLHFDSSKLFNVVGSLIEVTPPLKKKDPNFDNMEITIHNNKAIFTQKVVLIKKAPLTVKGYLEFMACNDQKCIPPKDVDFTLNVLPLSKIQMAALNKNISANEVKEPAIKKTNNTDSAKIEASKVNSNTGKRSTNGSLWNLFIKAILAGLGGVFTPCVYPMIPLTVMFFLKGNEKRSIAILKGTIFGLSIIVIYVVLGLILGPVLQLIASYWLSNLFFFLLFIAFALSFLGLFEIVLPGSLATKVDKQADKGGYLGVFFMALALVIVSASCTVPLIGSVLIEGSSNFKQSVISMLGYSLAFAFPFSFLAMFPALLNSLPHSGGWLNVVKVILGLIILMFSFKYLVIVDQSLHLNLLSREIVMSIWTAILIFAGLYLLGKIKFAHDSEVGHVSILRFLLAMAAFSFGIYIFGSMIYGGNLENFASFFPAQTERTESFGSGNVSRSNALCGTPKYSDFLHLPYGLQGYFDYKEGLACAKQLNKPVLIDFKGYSCTNCKVMDAKVWSRPEVKKLLEENFIIVALYADESTILPENEWYKSKNGKLLKRMGQQNQDIETSIFGTNALPLYAIVNSDGESLVDPIGTEFDVQKYISFLKKGLENFKNKAK